MIPNYQSIALAFSCVAHLVTKQLQLSLFMMSEYTNGLSHLSN